MSTGLTASGGQSGDWPLHCSSTSQLPAAARQVPDESTVQVPSALAPFARLQAWQSEVLLPPQSLSQQTPSAQKPVVHWLPVAHAEGQVAWPWHRYAPQVPTLPAASTVQAPLAVAPSAAAQTSHPPAQAPLQQKPSTQLPDTHWLAAVQDWPSAFFPTHAPPMQVLPAAHCASEVQLEGQAAVPPQT